MKNIAIVEDEDTAAAFSLGSELISSKLVRNTGLKVLRPLLQDGGKFTAGVFFRELAIGVKDNLQETAFDLLFYKIKQLFVWEG